MYDFWYALKLMMEEHPWLSIFIFLIVAFAVVTWIMYCIVSPSLIIFTVIILVVAFGLWKFCKWMISKHVEDDD